MRRVVWETWKSGKAAWRTEEFLFLPARCQPWENRTCSFPLGLLQRNMYIVFTGGKKRTFISISYFCGDVLTSEEVEVAYFYEDYIGSSGAAHNEGDLQIYC